MKNVSKLNKNTSMKLSTAAVVLLSALGVSTIANAADNFIRVSDGTEEATVGISKDVAVGRNAKETLALLLAVRQQ
ncbi:hypothetical protein ACTHTQ_08335 [Neisseria sp. P0020.S003]|uniref:hypothetical protein n=1 Tax=Neisseria sp. P0020.S003 TaxID=3436808 RepID=UPI003F8196E9